MARATILATGLALESVSFSRGAIVVSNAEGLDTGPGTIYDLTRAIYIARKVIFSVK